MVRKALAWWKAATGAVSAVTTADSVSSQTSLLIIYPFGSQIEKSQRDYLLPQDVTVNCCLMAQYLKDHREDTHGLRPLQFVVAEYHNI